jgi:hypothetical protein
VADLRGQLHNYFRVSITDISWSETGFCDVLWGCWLGGGVLSDPVYKLSAEVELGKSPAVSHGAVLAVGSEESYSQLRRCVLS